MNNPAGDQHSSNQTSGASGDTGLTVDIDERDHIMVATVRGVLDFSSANPFPEQLTTALNRGTPRLVLNLQAVTFVDSTGLALLVSIQRQVQAAGGWLRLANPHTQLRRVLHITSLDEYFEVHHSVDSATATP
jgi:anti-sigma B factor antagonist